MRKEKGKEGRVWGLQSSPWAGALDVVRSSLLAETPRREKPTGHELDLNIFHVVWVVVEVGKT